MFTLLVLQEALRGFGIIDLELSDNGLNFRVPGLLGEPVKKTTQCKFHGPPCDHLHDPMMKAILRPLGAVVCNDSSTGFAVWIHSSGPPTPEISEFIPSCLSPLVGLNYVTIVGMEHNLAHTVFT